MADYTYPISLLKRKEVPWQWEDNEMNAFELIKEAVQNAKILSYPDQYSEFVVETDASLQAMGAVLYQNQKDELKT